MDPLAAFVSSDAHYFKYKRAFHVPKGLSWRKVPTFESRGVNMYMYLGSVLKTPLTAHVAHLTCNFHKQETVMRVHECGVSWRPRR